MLRLGNSLAKLQHFLGLATIEDNAQVEFYD